ncbi:MAG: hypothetical protein WC796_00125 [Candidatus Pacearchaeota archaeon]|jgi:hypothetical protein
MESNRTQVSENNEDPRLGDLYYSEFCHNDDKWRTRVYASLAYAASLVSLAYPIFQNAAMASNPNQTLGDDGYYTAFALITGLATATLGKGLMSKSKRCAAKERVVHEEIAEVRRSASGRN